MNLSEINIRKTDIGDIDYVMPIFDEARRTIATLGIDQWQNGYPNVEVIKLDIEKGGSYVVEKNSVIGASFAVVSDGEPTYDKIYLGEWKSGNENRSYLAIHRVAISVKLRGQGIASAMIEFCADMAKRQGRNSLRIDTHRGNVVMRRMLEKNGFEFCGVIYLQSGEERVAYEKLI